MNTPIHPPLDWFAPQSEDNLRAHCDLHEPELPHTVYGLRFVPVDGTWRLGGFYSHQVLYFKTKDGAVEWLGWLRNQHDYTPWSDWTLMEKRRLSVLDTCYGNMTHVTDALAERNAEIEVLKAANGRLKTQLSVAGAAHFAETGALKADNARLREGVSASLSNLKALHHKIDDDDQRAHLRTICKALKDLMTPADGDGDATNGMGKATHGPNHGVIGAGQEYPCPWCETSGHPMEGLVCSGKCKGAGDGN